MSKMTMTAKGQVEVAASGRGGVTMRSTAIERIRRRALEQMDPFSHGGYQPETLAEPVSDPVVEIDMLAEARQVARKSEREIVSVTVRKISE